MRCIILTLTVLAMSVSLVNEVTAQGNSTKITLPDGRTYAMNFVETKMSSGGGILFIGEGSYLASEESIKFIEHKLVCEKCSTSSSKARVSATSCMSKNRDTGLEKEVFRLEFNATGDDEFIEFGFGVLTCPQ